ncbi:MAG: C-GCAxxG-C-C family protein [Chloroflexota bacterium]
MGSISERAVSFWNSGYYCAESVLMAAAEGQDIKSDLIPKIASGFCSGVAQTGGMCGALSGAVMSLGLRYGRGDSQGERDLLYQKTQKLVGAFEEKFGSTNCSQLLDLELGTEAGQAAYQERELIGQCEGYVGEAARLMEELLE